MTLFRKYRALTFLFFSRNFSSAELAPSGSSAGAGSGGLVEGAGVESGGVVPGGCTVGGVLGGGCTANTETGSLVCCAVELVVNNMTCGKCVGRVQRALKADILKSKGDCLICIKGDSLMCIKGDSLICMLALKADILKSPLFMVILFLSSKCTGVLTFETFCSRRFRASWPLP